MQDVAPLPVTTDRSAAETYDRARFLAGIERIYSAAGRDAAVLRPVLLQHLKTTIGEARTTIRRRFEAGAGGEATARTNALLFDEMIRAALDAAAVQAFPAANPTAAERLAVLAVGGYGRGELAPFSDIDLLFLVPYKETPRLEQIVEFTLYVLWDLGLKVGHATRSVDDSIRLAKADITIRTAILEARHLWGEQALSAELKARFNDGIARNSGPEFAAAKLAERDERHRRFGGSRYVLEPNVKEGKGGLRDLHTLYWIAKYLYRMDEVVELVEKGVLDAKEARRFDRAHEFLWKVRCHLHYLGGRGEDRLTFDMQTEIGRRMNYRDNAGLIGVERFMKHYYLHAKDVGDLTRIFCAALEAEHKGRPRFPLSRLRLFQREVEGFAIEGGRLSIAKNEAFAEDPTKLLRLFRVAQENELDIHPRALRHVTRHLRLVDQIREDGEANRLFLEMLTSRKDPETTLRRLNEAGVFGRFVPDFGRVVAQMQHDMYHVYTVDEHTIFAIGILHGIEQGNFADDMPVVSEVVHNIQSRNALYLGLLLHDIGKGRGGDHSEIGAQIALRMGPRLGLNAEETETASWLVRHHLVMSQTAFHRDINDPKTIQDFVALVQSVERLRLLIVLTASDIRAVGPNVWNGWKAALLRNLYYAAEAVIAGGFGSEARDRQVAAAQDALRQALPDFATEEIEAHFALGYPSYWLSFDGDTLAYHARLVRGAAKSGAPLTVDTRIDRFRAVTEITIYTHDHPGLFSRIAGAMALSGANIVDAKIHTLTNGMALDSFRVQDATAGAEGAAFARPDKIAKLVATIEQTLSGKLRPMQELAKRLQFAARARVFTVAPRVLIDNEASRTHTVIEINGLDRPGLLYDLTRALTRSGVSIASAHISTFGERVVDVFYVKDVFGLKVDHEGKLEQIRAALLAALEIGAEPGS